MTVKQFLIKAKEEFTQKWENPQSVIEHDYFYKNNKNNNNKELILTR